MSIPIGLPEILVDETTPCYLCKNSKNNICDDCDNVIPVYENMGGVGYQSQTWTHMHVKNLSGIPGRKPARRKLCLECYRIDFKKKYPDLELPV